MSKCDPRAARGREPLQEQGGGDRAGLRPGVGIVLEIGDVAVQRRGVGRPQRHAPQRIARPPPRPPPIRRPARRRRCRREPPAAPAPPAPRRSGWPGRWSASGSSSPARVRASARISRPSASVLPTSMVSPLREASTSPGRMASPEMAFSTAGISTHQAHRQPRGHDHPAERQGVGRAAHVLLHQPHAGRGLDVQAAGVEHHALADQGDQRDGRPRPR